MKITQGELLEALAKARETKVVPNEDALTLREMMEASGVTQHSMMNAVRRLVATNEWECVKVHRQQMSGIMMPTWGYRPKKLA